MSRLPHIDVTDLREVQAVVVVSVSWCGRTWRLSSRSLEFSGGEHVLPGLVEGIEVTELLALKGGGADEVSISLQIVLPEVDVAAMLADGFDLVDATAEVAIVWHRNGVPVHAWEASHVLADGDLSAAHYGDPKRPPGWLSATIVDSPYRQEAPLVPRSWEINLSTWPLSPDLGEAYLEVFGAPVLDADDPDADALPPARSLLYDAIFYNVYLLLTAGPCVATQVDIVDGTGAVEAFPIFYMADGLGQLVACVNTVGATVIDPDASPFHSSWAYGPARAPFDVATATAVLTAGHLLAAGGAKIDLPEWIRVGSQYKLPVAGWLDDPDSRAWEVTRDLLSSLPIGMHRGDGGWAPCLLDPGSARTSAVETVREGEVWRRVSQWQTEEGTSRVASVEMTYPTNSTVRVGATLARDGPLPHAWIRHLPRLDATSGGLNWTWSPQAAEQGARWSARSQALGWRAAAWQVPTWATRLRCGEWVELVQTDGSTRYALATRRTLTDGIWDYTLVLPGGA